MRIGTVIAATLILALARTATAQPVRSGAEADPVYHVEVILFAFNDGNRNEEDLHHDEESDLAGPRPQLLRLPSIELESVFDLPAFEPSGEPGEPGDIGDIGETADTSVAEPEGDALELFETSVAASAGDRLPAGFRPLLRSELRLVAERRALDRLAAYTILGHAGWALAGVDTDRSVPLDLKRVGITNPRGTIEVYLRRFLHTRLDLEFFEGSGTLWRPAGGFGLVPLEYAETYRLIEEINAMRSNDPPHFADHPLYGVLVQITEAPEPEEDENGNAAGPAG